MKIDPEIQETLERFRKSIDRALTASQKSLKTPRINLFGKCPNCKSKRYFPLYGGACKKICAKCNQTYDCLSQEDYLKSRQV